MSLRLITAHDSKPGATIMIDGNACVVRTLDISKTGKHGASKCRMDAIGILDGKKRVIAVPGSERFEVPSVEKRKAQVLSINGEIANVMDLENFETYDIPIFEEVRNDIKPEDQVEYVIINETQKIIKRKL